MLVVVAPGQGSQSPGFLSPWLELPGYSERMQWLSAVTGLDLVEHGTRSDAATIKDTAIAQPLIVAAGLVTLPALFEHPADGHRAVSAGAGHSVGEITSAAAAGVLTTEQAMVLVRERGLAMAHAASLVETGMSAVVGGDPTDVEAAILAAGLTPANMNGAGQIVAAGTLEQLAALAAAPPPKARVMPLPVAGAFHTHHMASAVELLDGYARAMSVHDARVPLVSNRDGTVIHSGREILQRIVTQVSNPVRWDLTMQTLLDLGATAMIELPPAGTLTGLAKRAMRGVEVVALKSPDNLDAAHRLIREHGGHSDPHPDPAWRVVIAPAKGTVNVAELAVGQAVPAESVVASVHTLRDCYEVTASHAGRVLEWLVDDGDPVAPGQPIVRLHPQESIT